MMSTLAHQNAAAASRPCSRHVVISSAFRTHDCCSIPSLFEIPPPQPQPLPQPPHLMSHQKIDIPLSPLPNDGAALEAAVGGACDRPFILILKLNHSPSRPLK